MNILITGATGGIGREICRGLTPHKIIALGTKDLDVSNKLQVKNFFSKIKKLDVLINCAGILGPVGKFEENDLKKWVKTVEINFLGTVYTSYFAVPLLKKSRRGKIINFAGGGSAYPRLYHSAYGSSKTAVVRFTETLAQEYPKLDVNVIAPGAYKTKIWNGETYDKEPKKWGDFNRLKKFIKFLVSEKSDGITGKFIHYMDKWEGFKKSKLSKDVFTLRRVEK
jgi:NAD(P)-dependent dehydrogenase (short-subunit alcohol dehydrogenase family)